MKKKLAILGITVVLIAVGFSGCTEERQETLNRDGILDKFDGYQWSWWCWDIENKFTLWKEHITKIEKDENYWLIEGFSSDRDDATKSISSDESGKILIVYDEKNDKITDWLHGGQIPTIPEINEEGKITNGTGLVYC